MSRALREFPFGVPIAMLDKAGSDSEPIIWVNYNNSPTWIKAIWGWFPLLTMISSEGEQWGRDEIYPE